MCGISGLNWKNKEMVEKMTSTLSHRGPDALGYFVGNEVSLGHRRLSVIDLSDEANQPMEDDNFVLVYNGEIYNFLDLRKDLESDYKFRTKSDTEVILAGYHRWGQNIVEHLDGMFSFAIWDKKNKSLFLARDHVGIKPLYYYWDGQKFIFASELKAVFESGIVRKLNRDGFNYYLRSLYTPDSVTMIQNVFKLPPSHTIFLKGGKISISKYEINGSNDIFRGSFNDAKKILRQKVISSVSSHLISDVPVGLYLSGGIDSSVVLAAMSQTHKDIKTFSVGFKLSNKDEEQKYNHDFNLAQKTSDFFGTKHFSFIVSTEDILNNLEETFWHNDDPVSNPTSIVMYLLSKFAKKEVTVALTGSGGDELFGGYERYRIALVADYYNKLPNLFKLPSKISNKVSKLEYKEMVDLFAKFLFEKDFKIEKVISSEFFKQDSWAKELFQEKYFSNCQKDITSCLMLADQKGWLPDFFFSLSDKMSMANSLEERVPLISRDLVSFANSLPREFKVGLRQGKKVLKEAFREDLPDFLFNQPKRGWFAPGAKWLREPEFSNFAHRVLSDDYYKETSQLFDWIAVRRMLDDHIEKKEYNLTLIWAIFSFQIWAKKHKICL